MIKKYLAEIVSIVQPVNDIFTVEMRSLDSPFKYAPGQFLHLALEPYDPSYAWPESRCFSMQSSPQDELIKITYPVKGDFTKRMATELKIGKLLNIKLPYGELFSKEHSKENTVFIAGGTGITPFLSLFNDDSFKEYIHPSIYLGFRSISYNMYSKELNLVKLCVPKIFYEDTNGHLNIHQIFSENGANCDYFISGPPIMIKVFKQVLLDNGVPRNKVLSDDWE